MSPSDHGGRSRIGDRIRDKRRDRGYSQEYMAERLGISPSAYCRMENGARVDIEQLRDVAEVLEADIIEDFLGQETVVVNMRDPQGGGNGCYNTLNQSGVPEDVLRRMEDRYETHVRELQQVNARLMALLERLAGEGKP